MAAGICAGLAPTAAVTSFSNGFGATMASTGILIALGAMFGKLLADSGGADRIVDTLLKRGGPRSIPWIMALIGGIIGLPMFFEIGLVLLIPVILLVSRRSKQPLLRVGIPALAGLSAMHGLVPPHPGPLVAVTSLGANLGLTLGVGILVAIPAVIISGPLFGRLAARWVPVGAPDLFVADEEEESRPRPAFGVVLIGVLLPVVLMLANAIHAAVTPGATDAFSTVLAFLGTPLVALTIALVYAMLFFGRAAKMTRREVESSLASGLPAIAGIALIVGAGGGFKQVLIDSGLGTLIGQAVADTGALVLLIAWAIAALVRVSVGSATVATVTASGILASLAAGMPVGEVSLLVLAIGDGSLFLSHVNDAGFWMIKEYFGLSVGQTLRSWSLMECVISLSALGGVLLLSLLI